LKDLTRQCLEDVKSVDAAATIQVLRQGFCKGSPPCRNPGCLWSVAKGTLFESRIATNFDRLLNSEKADPNDKEFEHIRNQDFKDVNAPTKVFVSGYTSKPIVVTSGSVITFSKKPT